MFWEDNWSHLCPLWHIIHDLLLPHEFSLKVADVSLAPRVWDWDLLSFVLPSHIHDFIIATPVNLHSNSFDSRVWYANLNGEFDLSSAYSIVAYSLSINPYMNGSLMKNFKWIWSSRCHIRRKFFIWKLSQNVVHVKSILATRDLTINLICPMCGQDT